jgi:DNA-binding NarL/FixJ family response regulator
MQRSDPLDTGVLDSPLRLVIADDHEATRKGLGLALSPLGFSVAAEAADADSAIGAVLRERPEQCLIATHLPGGGIRAATEIHARAPEVAIVMLDTAADETALFAALDAGAAGYLLKDIEPGALGDALRGVHRGEAAIPRHLVAALVSEFRDRSPGGDGLGRDRARLASLTERQLRVLELLSTGASTVEVGRRLAIAPTTVRRHLSTIVARLGVDGRAGAIEAYRAVRASPAGRRALARRGGLGIGGSGGGAG